MSFTGTIGALILFSGSTNSPPVRMGYFDGTSINTIPVNPSVPQSLTPYYVGKGRSSIPYIFGVNDLSQTRLYEYSSENEEIESVGTITYPERGRYFLDVSYIAGNIVVICSGMIYYYKGGNFTVIPQTAQYDDSLGADIVQTIANRLELLQDGRLYAFGRFVSADGRFYYASVSSADGIKWNVVKNSRYVEGTQNFLSGVNIIGSDGQNTRKVLLVGCQKTAEENLCNLSCNTSRECVGQISKLDRYGGFPTDSVINDVWVTSTGYIGAVDNGGYHGIVTSSNTLDWKLLYSNGSPIVIKGISYTPVTNFVYSPELVRMVVVASYAGNYFVLSNTNLSETTGWSAVQIPRAYGNPYRIESRPSPTIGSAEDEKKSAEPEKTTWETIWGKYKMTIIFGVITVIFILLRIYVSFVKSLQSQQAAIVALTKSAGTPPK